MSLAHYPGWPLVLYLLKISLKFWSLEDFVPDDSYSSGHSRYLKVGLNWKAVHSSSTYKYIKLHLKRKKNEIRSNCSHRIFNPGGKKEFNFSWGKWLTYFPVEIQLFLSSPLLAFHLAQNMGEELEGMNWFWVQWDHNTLLFHFEGNLKYSALGNN